MTGHRYIGSGSWWFTEAIEQAPLAALFVRDTVGLDVPTGGVIPPQLEGRLPNNSHLLDPRTRAAAAAAWTGWWEAVLTQDIRQHQHRPADLDQRVWMRQLAAEYQTVFDPPNFIGLTDRPALREAVMATRDQALGWSDVRRRALLSPRHARNGQFDHDMARDLAAPIGDRRQISHGTIGGCAVLIPVKGIWWHPLSPGAVVCSVNAAQDPAVARTIVTHMVGSSSSPHITGPGPTRNRH